MGKRSVFERRERDYYPTPKEAVQPLLRHLPKRTVFIEPCAGDGSLVRHLECAGHVCASAYDIEPMAEGIERADALTLRFNRNNTIITNPPWSRDVLHEMIVWFSSQASTWLLFDADWMHTRQAAPYLHLLRKIVSVGRVKWIPDSPYTGKDNCCWYLFDARDESPAQFFGRVA